MWHPSLLHNISCFISTFPNINIATLVFFCFSDESFFSLLLYNLYMYLNLRCISYRLHVVGLCFLIQYYNLWHLTGVCSLFIFNVIICIIWFNIHFARCFYLLLLLFIYFYSFQIEYCLWFPFIFTIGLLFTRLLKFLFSGYPRINNKQF